MKNRFNFLVFFGVLLAVGLPTHVLAQKRYIYGSVCDALTQQQMKNVCAVLYDMRGVPIDSMLSGTRGQVNETKDAWVFAVKNEAADYSVRFSMKGYEPQEISVKFRPNRRSFIYEMGNIKLRRVRERQLGEATVKATRVMLYTKKDTLVYNADEFQLAEGSMLDALIKQLPGVELKSDGRILVNGKQVENLLLNGEDFFKGNNEVLLDNLPSYMVQNVQVYEKQGRLSEMMNRDMNDKEYVMDVRLKKQYSIGYMGNVEGGYGSEDRYMGRLFGLRFTPQSRVSVFGNLNNVNETRKPGEDGNWSPSNVTVGQNATKHAGLDYQVKDRRKRWEASGNAAYQHGDNTGVRTTSTTNFLPAGDTYNRSHSVNNNCNSSFTTNHNFYLKRQKAQLWITPNFKYSKWNNHSSLANLYLTDNLFNRKELLDSMMMSVTQPKFWQAMTSRMLSETLGRGHQTFAWLGMTYNQSFRNNNDLLQTTVKLNHSATTTDNFSHYLYENKNSAGGDISGDFRNRYSHQSPDRYSTQQVQLKYWAFFPGNWAIVPFYRYYHARQRKDYATYRLDALSEQWGAGATLGALPSETEYMQAIDRGNSYDLDNRESEHFTGFEYQWEGELGKGYMQVNSQLPVRVTTHEMNYLRAASDTTFSHTTVFVEPSANVKYAWNNWNRELTLNYSMEGGFVPMTARVNYLQDEDPLNVTVSGGTDLDHRYTHSVQLRYSDRRSAKYRFFNASVRYNKVHNALAYAQMYDRQTDRRTYRMMNVNGNYDLGATVDYTLALDKAKRLILVSNTGYSFYHNVDLIGETSDGRPPFVEAQPLRSVVKTSLLEQALTLRWKLGKQNLNFNVSGNWHHVSGTRENFDDIDAGSFKYGVTGKFELPWQMQLATDITMYSRRGYANKSMNTDDLVWNMRLSKRFWKNRLTLMVDGFDLLHQLSGTSFSVNGQGQTETWRNVIPRYVMLHLVYRLNIKPKKLAGE